MQYIYLLPFAKIHEQLLNMLAKDVEKKFFLPVKVLSPLAVPAHALNLARQQYDGNKILAEIKQIGFSDLKKIIGLCGVDLYSGELNFIFGLAEAPGRAALVSYHRLRPEFYFAPRTTVPRREVYPVPRKITDEQSQTTKPWHGVYQKKPDFELLYGRLLKEIMHELGHAFGVAHCPEKKCVMYYSNIIEDTDQKDAEFCKKCGKIYQARNF